MYMCVDIVVPCVICRLFVMRDGCMAYSFPEPETIIGMLIFFSRCYFWSFFSFTF